MTISLSNLSDLARKRVAVAAYYFVPGVVFASWASRIPVSYTHLDVYKRQVLPSVQLEIFTSSRITWSRPTTRLMVVILPLSNLKGVRCV